MANLLSTVIRGFIGSEKFFPGFTGSGWKIWKHIAGKENGGKAGARYKLEIDDLVVRNTMTVFELLISKIRAIKGAMAITQANGKVKQVYEDPDHYFLEIEDEMSFMEYDIVRCQKFGDNKLQSYWVEVKDIVKLKDTVYAYAPESAQALRILKSEFAGAVPRVGDELVQFGNSASVGALKYRNRHSAIYLCADEAGQPTIDVLQGIDSKSFEGCMKLRIGGLDGIDDTDFTEGIRSSGIYCTNGYFKGTIAGAGGYMLRSDGTGYICNGAIAWDENKKVHIDSSVVLKWENLSEETKQNLKGMDADLVFPWLQDWVKEGTEIDGQKVVSPRMFSGNWNNGAPTGVAMGREVITVDGVKKTGIFGVREGVVTFSLDANTGDAIYSGAVNIGNNKIELNEDGSGRLANGNITWDKFGQLRITGIIRNKPSLITPQNYDSYQTSFDNQPKVYDIEKTGLRIIFEGDFPPLNNIGNNFLDNIYLPYSEGAEEYIDSTVYIKNNSNLGLPISGYLVNNMEDEGHSYTIQSGHEGTFICKIRTYKEKRQVVWLKSIVQSAG